MEHRVLLVRIERAFGRRQLADLDPVERPAVRGGDRAQLFLGLRQRDVEHRLARLRARQQELQRQRRLAGAGHAFDQEQASAGETAAQDVVEPGDAGRCDRRRTAHDTTFDIDSANTLTAPQILGAMADDPKKCTSRSRASTEHDRIDR